MSTSRSQAVSVLKYYEYLSPEDDRGGRTRYFCGSCRRDIGGVYGSACYGYPKTVEELERRNSIPRDQRTPLYANEDPLEYYTFCPWCGIQFEDGWNRDRTIQNERTIDHYKNPGTHKGDTHEFRSPASEGEPTWMAGHWLGTTDSRVCWCEPEIEPGVMGCVIRHRDVPMPTSEIPDFGPVEDDDYGDYGQT